MAELLTVTPSSVDALQSCLKKYKTLHVLRQYPSVKTTTPFLRLGLAVHAAMRDLYDPKRPGPLPHLERMESIIHFAFLRGGYNDEDRAFEMERGRRLIHAYLKDADMEDADATVGVEVSGNWPVRVAGEPLYMLSARLDRVLIFPSGLVAGIDYKIGAKLPPISSVLINLLALKALHPQAPAYEFWIENLSDEGVERTVYKSSDFKGAIKELTHSVRRYMGSEDHPAEPSDGCLYCPLRPGCQGTDEQAIDAEELEF